MSKLRKPPEGSKLIPFEPIKEPWSEYQLADGNVLRLRTNMIAIYDTGKKNPDGTPVYFYKTNPSVAVFTEEDGYVRMIK